MHTDWLSLENWQRRDDMGTPTIWLTPVSLIELSQSGLSDSHNWWSERSDDVIKYPVWDLFLDEFHLLFRILLSNLFSSLRFFESLMWSRTTGYVIKLTRIHTTRLTVPMSILQKCSTTRCTVGPSGQKCPCNLYAAKCDIQGSRVVSY